MRLSFRRYETLKNMLETGQVSPEAICEYAEKVKTRTDFITPAVIGGGVASGLTLMAAAAVMAKDATSFLIACSVGTGIMTMSSIVSTISSCVSMKWSTLDFSAYSKIRLNEFENDCRKIIRDAFAKLDA